MRVAIILIVLILCAGCEATFSNNSTQREEAGTIQFDKEQGKYVTPVTLETVGAVNPDVVFINGETLENNVHTRWAEERLGIRIKYLWTITDINNSYSNKLRLELAKGTLPDIVTTRDFDLINELIDSGQFMEVGQLFDQHASDVWKDAMMEEPSVWDAFSRDGLKYAIPILDFEYTSDPVLWIREDWLENLGLAEPKTFTELEAVMEAFTNQDPDGNGEDDTYGLTISLIHGVNTWMADSSWVFGAYEAIPQQWNLQADNSLVYGSVLPGTKEALHLLKQWIEKGYISGDSQWYDETKAAQLFTSGKAGIIAGPYWMAGWPLSDLNLIDAHARYKAIPLPIGPEGTVLRRGKLPVNGAILINKKMEHPEIFFTYQNYLFDYYAVSEGEFTYGLAKGYDWNTINETDDKDISEISPEEVIFENLRVAAYTLTFDGARIPSYIVNETPEDSIEVLLSQQEASRKDMYTGPPTTTMKEKWELLGKLEQNTFNSILFGDATIEAFDDFVVKWGAYGGSKITEEVNDWYDRKQNNLE
ncbi:extracellular solute-binding protein [Paenibacillus septentrionalis]|uniref:Extracellular solute-binding protein n=1 Tax=Paenibacillus septentrionalis TaxID=429342 RepID=A0ABW1V5W9_9BACL